ALLDLLCRDGGRIRHRSPALLWTGQLHRGADPSVGHMDHSCLCAGAHCDALGNWRLSTTCAHFPSEWICVSPTAIRSNGIGGGAQQQGGGAQQPSRSCKKGPDEGLPVGPKAAGIRSSTHG